ncbi:hypothetical protein TRVA0_001S08790 [Trichomonascus vanleenenianus]|uniref:uncharacterized protein n=1 Tax=Trichomonascus vanleenenianus TaxID=2268995 RepID=UPI003EC95699
MSQAQKCKALRKTATDPRVQTLFRYDQCLQKGNWDEFLDAFDDIYCYGNAEELVDEPITVPRFLLYIEAVEEALVHAEDLKEAIQCHIEQSKRYIDTLVGNAEITEIDGVLLMLKPIRSGAIRLFLTTELKYGNRKKLSIDNFWESALNGGWYTKNILGDGCNGPVVEKMVAIYATAPDNLSTEEAAIWYQLQKALRRAYSMHTDKQNTNIEALRYLRPVLKRAFVDEVVDRLDIPSIVSFFLSDYDKLYVPIAMENVIADTNTFLLEPSSAELKDVFERWMNLVMQSLSQQAPRLPKEETFPFERYLDKSGNLVPKAKQFDPDKVSETDLVRWLAYYDDVIADPETMTAGRLGEFLLGFTPLSHDLVQAGIITQRQRFSVLLHMMPDAIYKAIGRDWYTKDKPFIEQWSSLCAAAKLYFEGYVPHLLILSKFKMYIAQYSRGPASGIPPVGPLIMHLGAAAFAASTPRPATCRFCSSVVHPTQDCPGLMAFYYSVDPSLLSNDEKQLDRYGPGPVFESSKFHSAIAKEMLSSKFHPAVPNKMLKREPVSD